MLDFLCDSSDYILLYFFAIPAIVFIAMATRGGFDETEKPLKKYLIVLLFSYLLWFLFSLFRYR